VLAFHAGLAAKRQKLRLSHTADLHGFLKRATAVTLLTLGTGLIAGAWWSWRTLGSLLGADPVLGWMATAWLLAGTSLLSWRLGRMAGRLAAGLAVLAACSGIFGLLAAADLIRLLN
jgi:hypothetical protein